MMKIPTGDVEADVGGYLRVAYKIKEHTLGYSSSTLLTPKLDKMFVREREREKESVYSNKERERDRSLPNAGVLLFIGHCNYG
jgi:hypothetical protein